MVLFHSRSHGDGQCSRRTTISPSMLWWRVDVFQLRRNSACSLINSIPATKAAQMSVSETGIPSREYRYMLPVNEIVARSAHLSATRATTGAEKDGGKGHNGGVWEWTSTILEKHEGFVNSDLYPGCVLVAWKPPFDLNWLCTRYSADFFDGKHQVVVSNSYYLDIACFLSTILQIGGSYATIPRLSERRTLRNYYQHNYPYPWVAGRIAYDAWRDIKLSLNWTCKFVTESGSWQDKIWIYVWNRYCVIYIRNASLNTAGTWCLSSIMQWLRIPGIMRLGKSNKVNTRSMKRK